MKWSVDDYIKNASYVSQYGEDIVALLEPLSGEHILDLGCGDGELAEKIALKGCKITAIDSSKDMIHAAQKRGLDAYVMSGEDMNFKDEFHAIFSNAALHWMKLSDRVIENVFNALKANGRFCAEMGGSGNVQTIIAQIYKALDRKGFNGDDYNPWYFPSQEEYAQQLEQAGFKIDFIDQFERLTKLPTDVAGWLETFAKPFLLDIPEAQSDDFIQEIKEGVADTLKDKDGNWYADYVRLRFNVIKNDSSYQ
jgi:trans-aconitate methyltransferase